jgi:hypothetical protein
LAVRRLLRALLQLLIHLLDWAFPILLQIFRFPLFTLRIIGDGLVAVMKGVVSILPVASASKSRWREMISERWAWIRQHISYHAFEHWVHNAFEKGMAWVFKTCRSLSPRTALLVLLGAVLWLPISFGAATAMHAILLAKATVWPAWLQLLHPLATIIAKSKLLVLPVYPAAWPQAKQHPLVQELAREWHVFKELYLVRKTAFRYGEAEQMRQSAWHEGAGVAERSGVAARWRSFVAALGIAFDRMLRAMRRGARRMLRRLSRFPLIGPVINNYLDRYAGVEEPTEQRVSERVRGFFGRWSIKFTAEYYEAREREAAQAATPPVQAH